MEMSRSLMIVLALLSLGMCGDMINIYQGAIPKWFAISFLLGRLAAIGGLITRTRRGFQLAMGFFCAIILLNLLAAGLSPDAAQGASRVVIGAGMPLICIAVLWICRDEFE